MRESAARARKNIGEVLADLRAEFPEEDIKAPKLRFLEAEGLIKPERTASGYRKYSVQDMERLRYIITMQREHYMPLRVIREHLDAIDRGLQSPLANPSPMAPQVRIAPDGTPDAESYRAERTDLRISRKELLKTAGISEELLEQLEGFGLIKLRTGARHYDSDALAVAKTAGELAAFGFEPRHLRSFKTAADREVGMIEQLVTAIRRSREDGAEGRASQAIDEVAALSVRLHAALVKAGLRSLR